MINGYNIIKKITINKNKMFYCERKKILKNEYIFCRIIFNKKVNSKTLINIKNKTFRFLKCVFWTQLELENIFQFATYFLILK